MSDKRPRDVGWYGWFALGAVVVGVIGLLTRATSLISVGLLLAILWGGTALVRVVRIHRYVKTRG